MNRLFRHPIARLTVFAPLLALSTQALAAHGEHESPFGWAFIFSIINFTILAFILYFVMKKPMQEFFRKRSTDTRVEMEKAKKYYDEASRKFEEIEARLAESETEAKKLLETLRQEGESEKRHALQQAQDLADKIHLDSERIIAQELKKAQEQLKSETASLAAELAGKTVAASLSSEDQAALGKEFIARVSGAKG